MDNIKELDKKPWISKRRINLKKLIAERQHTDILLDCEEGGQRDDEEQSSLLAELDKFVRHDATEVKSYFMFNLKTEKTLIDEPNCKLKMSKLQLEHAKKMISDDRAYKVAYLTKLRSTRRELLMRHLAATNRTVLPVYPDDIYMQDDNTRVLSTQSEGPLSAIVVVQIWPQPQKSMKVRLEKEVLFRADQYLTELRDQFKCQRDYSVPMDLSENPEQAERIFRGELFKSSFFLIGDTFYNDMRDPNNRDLSTNLVEWAARQIIIRGQHGENARVGHGIGPFKRVKMEDNKFEDLEFRLGCPYLYLHQGDCEHLFTISDIRYVPNDLNLKQTKFPFVTAISFGDKADNLRCFMCKSRPPHWYTRNNDRVPVDPCFFCETCFYSFNYDESKKKIGNFQAYLYTSAIDIPEGVVMAANE